VPLMVEMASQGYATQWYCSATPHTQTLYLRIQAWALDTPDVTLVISPKPVALELVPKPKMLNHLQELLNSPPQAVRWSATCCGFSFHVAFPCGVMLATVLSKHIQQGPCG